MGESLSVILQRLPVSCHVQQAVAPELRVVEAKFWFDARSILGRQTATKNVICIESLHYVRLIVWLIETG